jgi:hypothetical protein
MTKEIFLFNMSKNEVSLNLKYDKNKIELDSHKERIEPGKFINLLIKNIYIENQDKLGINQKEIIIEKKKYPKLVKNGEVCKCIYDGIEGSNIDISGISEFNLLLINRNFELKKEPINRIDFSNFSVYLILNNRIIDNSIGQYKYIEPSGYNDVYGFSDENFESNKYNNGNLKIVLSYKINKKKKINHKY